jgi:hypothetical protein
MIQFYKPNKKVTGSACSFWLNDDGSIMASLIKQDGWNNQKNTGSFSKNKDNPNGRVIIKLAETEIGAILDCLETSHKWSTYHRSSKQTLQINFGPYERSGEQIGFSFSVNKQDVDDSTNKVGFIIGFNFGEGRYLKEFLTYLLNEKFKSFQQERKSSKNVSYRESKSSFAKKQQVKVEEVNLSEEEDDDLAW